MSKVWRVVGWIGGLTAFAAAVIQVWSYAFDPRPHLVAEVQYLPYRTATAHRDQYFALHRRMYESDFQMFMRKGLGDQDEPYTQSVNLMHAYFKANFPEELRASKPEFEPVGVWHITIRNIGDASAEATELLPPAFENGDLILPGKDAIDVYFGDRKGIREPRLSLGSLKPRDTAELFAWTTSVPAAESEKGIRIVHDKGVGEVQLFASSHPTSRPLIVSGAIIGLLCGGFATSLVMRMRQKRIEQREEFPLPL